MQQYTVTGMHCAACSASVEKAVKKVPGVTSCAVSLLTNSMGVEGTAEPAAVIKAVEDAGYGASVRGQEATPAADASALEDRQTPHLKKRLQKIGHVLIVDVKCAAVNIRTFRQLPNRNMLLRLLAHQLHESQAQLPFRFLHSAVNVFSWHSQRSLLYYKQFA